jgi:hypothetical protein
MSEMRRLIRIIETYSENNAALLRYMRKEEFDPYAHWYEVCQWLEDNDYLDEIANFLPDAEITSAEDLQEQEPDVFYKLPKEVQYRCGKDVVEDVMQHDPAEAPTWAHMGIGNKGKILNRSTWLVHFTNDPDGITARGFTIGVDQMDKLGLTTWTNNNAINKKYGGYNFAFEADSPDAKHAARKEQYGKYAVLFQNAGVKAYHYGDQEDQVMFWGKDVDPRDIIVLNRDYEGWIVQGSKPTRTSSGKIYRNSVELFKGDFERCVDWVYQNFQQYRRLLTRR